MPPSPDLNVDSAKMLAKQNFKKKEKLPIDGKKGQRLVRVLRNMKERPGCEQVSAHQWISRACSAAQPMGRQLYIPDLIPCKLCLLGEI